MRSFAGAIAIFSFLGLTGSADASVLFTAAETSPGAITQTATLGMGFSFGYFYTQIHGSCVNCLTANAGNGASLGTFDFSTVSGPFAYLTTPPTGTTQSAIPSSGSTYEHLDGYGTFLINELIGPDVLLGGANNYFGVSIWASPGSSTATMEFDLNGYATSNLMSLPDKPLYLDVTGTTTAPVTLTDLTPGGSPDYWAFTDPLTIDFTITLTDTPFSPSSSGGGGNGGGSVPEPWTWTLMLAGLWAFGMVLRPRRHSALEIVARAAP